MKRMSLVWGALVLALFCVSQSCSAQQNKNRGKGQTNHWFVEFNSNDIGLVRTILTLETSDTSFIGYTRKGADRNILSFFTSTLGRTFTKDFKDGSLIRITNGKIKTSGDTVILAGIFRSAMGSYYFNGNILNDTLKVELRNGKKELRGRMKGTKTVPELPIANYPAIVEQTLALTSDKIFRKELTTSKEYKKFSKQIRSVTPKLQDDLELVFGFFYFARNLPFSHYSLLRLPGKDIGSEPEEKLTNQVVMDQKTATTAYIKIKSFSGTATEMDCMFNKVREGGYKNLIVDLRDNSGGTIEAGMKFATNVATSEFYGGVFLTQKWFEKYDYLPQPTYFKNLPHFTEANFDLIIEGIHTQEALCLKIIPEKNPYSGNLFILTNSKTASTCFTLLLNSVAHNPAPFPGLSLYQA